MNVNDAFPSKTLKAGDLNGNNVTVVIAHVEVERVGSGKDAETKPVVYFRGKSKGLVLNKTNSRRITEIAGTPETDEWKGVTIILYPTETEYQGETVDCIRIKKPAVQIPRQPAPAPAAPADEFHASDEDVPF